MFLQTVIIVCLASLSCARFVDIEDDLPQEFTPEYRILLIPQPITDPILTNEEIHQPIRVRRQAGLTGSITPGNPGVRATVGAQGNVFNQNGHSLDAHGQVSRNFRPVGPTSVGGGLSYQGPRASATADVNHIRRSGTDLSVGGKVNAFTSQNRRTTIDVGGNYNRHYGGQFGTGKPSYNVGAELKHRF